MKIELNKVKIRDLVSGYNDNGDNGVFGFSGKLNIRPAYQREFVYKDKQREDVIRSVSKGFPLNVMYWVKNPNGYEVMDGQQRTISICQYVAGDYAVDYQFFHNLTEQEQNNILDYELMVYFCEGGDRDKLDWFETINIAGEKLTKQELRNAVYSGPFVAECKKWFSRNGGPAQKIGSKLLKGSAIRQDYLETALKWGSKGNIEEYMAENQHEVHMASTLWDYFQDVIRWTEECFPVYRKEMKGVDWGTLYNDYGMYETVNFEEDVSRLMMDDEVTKKSGIYMYLWTRNEKYLSIRSFTDNQKREAYERQGGICSKCNEKFDIEDMEGDHIDPWSQGGKTVTENLEMLCKPCNRRKSDK